MSKNSDCSFVTAKDFAKFTIGMFNMIASYHNTNFSYLLKIFEDHGLEKDIEILELKELDKDSIDLECYLGNTGTDYWAGVIKDIIQKIFKDYTGTICSNSPAKNKHTKAQVNTITEPTISSIRKAKLGIVANTDSSLSSRSISKDKKTTPLNSRLKHASRNSKQNKTSTQDYINAHDSVIKEKKLSIGKRVKPCSSQKSLNEENINYDKSKGILRTPISNKTEHK